MLWRLVLESVSVARYFFNSVLKVSEGGMSPPLQKIPLKIKAIASYRYQYEFKNEHSMHACSH